VNYTDKRVQHECTFYNSDFLIISSMCSFYIPTVIMVLLYWRIFATIRQRSRQARKQHLLQQRRTQGSAATADTSVTCLRAVDSAHRHQQQRRIAASATSLDDRRSLSTARLHAEKGSYKRQSQDSAVVVSNGGVRLVVDGQQSRANSVSDRSGGGDAAKQDDLDDLLDDDDIMQPASHAHELWTRSPPIIDVIKGGEGGAAAATAEETSPFLQVATNAAASSASVAKTNVASGNAGEKPKLGLPVAQASYELSINGRRNTYCDGGATVKILLPLNNGQHSMRSSLSSQADWSSVTFDDGAPNKMRCSFSFQLQRHRRGSSNSKEHDPNHPHHYQQQVSSTSSHGSKHEKLAHKREKKATKTLAIVLGKLNFKRRSF
jgi:ABC-type nickel/cobalt efflux system permease component RcnA